MASRYQILGCGTVSALLASAIALLAGCGGGSPGSAAPGVGSSSYSQGSSPYGSNATDSLGFQYGSATDSSYPSGDATPTPEPSWTPTPYPSYSPSPSPTPSAPFTLSILGTVKYDSSAGSASCDVQNPSYATQSFALYFTFLNASGTVVYTSEPQGYALGPRSVFTYPAVPNDPAYATDGAVSASASLSP